jgi:hypothetical protein
METMEPKVGGWMLTFSKKRFYPLDVSPDDICIEDIAHALSNLCRFGGHSVYPYSVAQHSVLVARLLPPELMLAGLLHDATEAYYVDVPRPVKAILPEYKRLEHKLELIIGKKFGCDFSDPRIKQADNLMLVTEARDVMKLNDVELADWGIGVDPLPTNIHIWEGWLAEHLFLKEFEKLTK